MKISLAMIVKNEEEHLEKCLERIKNIVDEIVIVDTGSTDNTLNIAKTYNAKVFEYEWNNDFSSARNYASEKCIGEWILVLDADEYVSVGDRKTLEEFVKCNNSSIGRIELHNKFEDESGITYSSEYISRFYPKGIKFYGIIHEQLDSNFNRLKMNFRVEHCGYYKTNKAKRNLPLLFKQLEKMPEDFYTLYQIGRTLYVDKSYIEAQKYFEVCCNLNSNIKKEVVIYYLYSIVRSNLNYEKGLEIINKWKDIYSEDPDFNFVCGIFYMNLILYDTEKYMNLIKCIEKCYLKCIEIGEYNSIVEGVGSYKAEYNLATFYEVTGQMNKAYIYYKKSAEAFFEPAEERLKILKII
ncbi:glycosyltransferase family 2 protein [Clostridium butyricum]|uniref:glycosyltransferase family 2 protein n=1 Tax=Clostridium butyricum TaxID=1492 RepID=UPI0032C08B3F